MYSVALLHKQLLLRRPKYVGSGIHIRVQVSWGHYQLQRAPPTPVTNRRPQRARAPRDEATSETPAMEEGDGGQDGVWSCAEEEAGRAIQNVIFLCFVFFSFVWRNWGEEDEAALL